MGTNHSQEKHRNRQIFQPPFGFTNRNESRLRKRSFFRRKVSTTMLQTNLPDVTETNSPTPLYANNRPTKPMPIYAPLSPMLPRLLPMSYNNFAIPSYASSQPVMILPQQVGPVVSTPYMNPVLPSSSPIIQTSRIRQGQPIYNNLLSPTSMPITFFGGNIFNPPLYSMAPTRLVTDWTGGGKISPGFLGPPI